MAQLTLLSLLRRVNYLHTHGVIGDEQRGEFKDVLLSKTHVVVDERSQRMQHPLLYIAARLSVFDDADDDIAGSDDDENRRLPLSPMRRGHRDSHHHPTYVRHHCAHEHCDDTLDTAGDGRYCAAHNQSRGNGKSGNSNSNSSSSSNRGGGRNMLLNVVDYHMQQQRQQHVNYLDLDDTDSEDDDDSGNTAICRISNMFETMPQQTATQLSPAQLTALWHHYDVDGNGVLDARECVRLVRHVLAHLASVVPASLRALLTCDYTRDERAEAERRIATLTQTLTHDADANAMAATLLSAMDSDADGRVSQQEFVAHYPTAITRELQRVSAALGGGGGVGGSGGVVSDSARAHIEAVHTSNLFQHIPPQAVMTPTELAQVWTAHCASRRGRAVDVDARHVAELPTAEVSALLQRALTTLSTSVRTKLTDRVTDDYQNSNHTKRRRDDERARAMAVITSIVTRIDAASLPLLEKELLRVFRSGNGGGGGHDVIRRDEFVSALHSLMTANVRKRRVSE